VLPLRRSALFPYTTLFRSGEDRSRLERELAPLTVPHRHPGDVRGEEVGSELDAGRLTLDRSRERLGEERLPDSGDVLDDDMTLRSEEHTSELQSRDNLVCR